MLRFKDVPRLWNTLAAVYRTFSDAAVTWQLACKVVLALIIVFIRYMLLFLHQKGPIDFASLPGELKLKTLTEVTHRLDDLSASLYFCIWRLCVDEPFNWKLDQVAQIINLSREVSDPIFV